MNREEILLINQAMYLFNAGFNFFEVQCNFHIPRKYILIGAGIHQKLKKEAIDG